MPIFVASARPRYKKRRQVFARASGFVILPCTALLWLFFYGPEEHLAQRRLESSHDNCQLVGLPLPIAIITPLCCFGIWYLLWAMAIICDDYLVTPLEEISMQLNLSPSVAGVTFMALAGSAPDFAISFAATFQADSGIGTATILGSALFNILVLIGGAIYFTPSALVIEWKMITRDVIVCLVSLCVLWVILHDGQATAVEALSLLALYAGYVAIMHVHEDLMKCVSRLAGEPRPAASADEAEDVEDQAYQNEEEYQQPLCLWPPVASACTRPLTAAFEATILKCSLPRLPKHWSIAIASAAWIAVLSVVLVSLATSLSCAMSTPPTIIGLVVLTLGTGVPDAVGTFFVALDGTADMAMSNAIGATAFDATLGLGLPWFLHGVVEGAVSIGSALGTLVAIVIGALLLMYALMIFARFQLTKPLGLIYVGAYALSVVAACVALTAPSSIEAAVPSPSSARIKNAVEQSTTSVGAPITCTYNGTSTFPCSCSNGLMYSCGGVAQKKMDIKSVCMSADAAGCHPLKGDGTCDSDKHFCGQYTCSTTDPRQIECPQGHSCQEIHGDDFKGIGLCVE